MLRDRCPVCEQYIRIRKDGRLAKHVRSRPYIDGVVSVNSMCEGSHIIAPRIDTGDLRWKESQ